MRYPMKPTVATARTPMTTMMATTIRMPLSAPPPPLVAGAAEGVVATFVAASGTAAPHLLQNFVPGVSVAPQELQNAMGHLVPSDCNGWGRSWQQKSDHQGLKAH